MPDATLTETMRAHGEYVVAVGPVAFVAVVLAAVRQSRTVDAHAELAPERDWQWPRRYWED